MIFQLDLCCLGGWMWSSEQTQPYQTHFLSKIKTITESHKNWNTQTFLAVLLSHSTFHLTGSCPLSLPTFFNQQPTLHALFHPASVLSEVAAHHVISLNVHTYTHKQDKARTKTSCPQYFSQSCFHLLVLAEVNQTSWQSRQYQAGIVWAKYSFPYLIHCDLTVKLV